MKKSPSLCLLWVLSILFLPAFLPAADLDEWKVKREPVFEFSVKPEVKRAADRIEISFTSKGACDATVVVEDSRGHIIRHLASGVLGTNAPAPFQKGSLKQKLIWDGKNDQGRYIDDKDSHTVRVSLGLVPVQAYSQSGPPARSHAQGSPLL